MKKLSHKDITLLFFSFIFISMLFATTSFVAKEYENELKSLVQHDQILGMFIYVFLNTLSVVIAPLSTLPLIPLASTIWGWAISGILSVIGWLLGAEIAFLLARYFGKPLIQKIISIQKIEEFEKQIPEKNLFFTVVFLRMFVSVDLLSYALGIFSNMKNTQYIFATLLGILPSAFIYAYTGTLPFVYQIAALLFGSIVTYTWYKLQERKYQTSK